MDWTYGKNERRETSEKIADIEVAENEEDHS